jgi:hypothetical protein
LRILLQSRGLVLFLNDLSAFPNKLVDGRHTLRAFDVKKTPLWAQGVLASGPVPEKAAVET